MSSPPLPSRAFVLGLADEKGHIDGAALYELGSAVGFTDTTTRLTVRRLAEAGLLESQGRGRSSSIRLTKVGRKERMPDLGWTALAYRLDGGQISWDGRWHMVSFEIPESQRSGRDALRNLLVDLMAAPLAGGLYVSPYSLKPWVEVVAATNGVESFVSTFSTDSLNVAGEHDPREIAAQLWPLDNLGKEMTTFVERWSPSARMPPDQLGDAARTAFQASAEFENLIRRDPLLPPELEPTKWPGSTARQIYQDLITALSDRHVVIKRANIFTGFLAAVDRTSAMSDDEFGEWVWEATKPSP